MQEEEDGEIEAETAAALCPPTTGGRRSLGMAATAEAEAATEATEEAAAAAGRGAGTGAAAGTDTPRTGPSPPPGTRGPRRSCSTRAMAPPASTLIGNSLGFAMKVLQCVVFRYEDIPVEMTGTDCPQAINGFDDVNLTQIIKTNIELAHYTQVSCDWSAGHPDTHL